MNGEELTDEQVEDCIKERAKAIREERGDSFCVNRFHPPMMKETVAFRTKNRILKALGKPERDLYIIELDDKIPENGGVTDLCMIEWMEEL